MSDVDVLNRYDVKLPKVVRDEAKRANLPLHFACAMLEMETGIPQRNIFGCDYGPTGDHPPYCHQNVTERRVHRLIESGIANGVGWTQLTYRPFVLEAERLGGAHKPRFQCRVGFRVLADNIQRLGTHDGFRAYNGSGSAAEAYADRAMQLAAKWRSRLDG